MKLYTKPLLEIVNISEQNVIACSDGTIGDRDWSGFDL